MSGSWPCSTRRANRSTVPLVERPEVALDQPVHAWPVALALLHDDAVQLPVGRGEVDELADQEPGDGCVVDAAQSVDSRRSRRRARLSG